MLRTLSINDYSTQTSHQPKGEEGRKRGGRGEGEERERRGRGEGEERERREVDQVMDLNYIKILLKVQANKSKISCYHN